MGQYSAATRQGTLSVTLSMRMEGDQHSTQGGICNDSITVKSQRTLENLADRRLTYCRTSTITKRRRSRSALSVNVLTGPI